MEHLEELKKLSHDQLVQRVILLYTKLNDLEKGSREICEKLSEQFKEQVEKNKQLEKFIENELGLNEVYPTECDESLLTKLG